MLYKRGSRLNIYHCKMSIKFSTLLKLILLFVNNFCYILCLLTAFALCFSSDAKAWAGYEESTNIAIDIPPGNLVRVGREVDFFDFNANNYHSAEVIFMEDIFSGTRLEVKDLETGENRIFYMER